MRERLDGSRFWSRPDAGRRRAFHCGQPRRRMRANEGDVHAPVIGVALTGSRHLVTERLGLEEETVERGDLCPQRPRVASRL